MSLVILPGYCNYELGRIDSVIAISIFTFQNTSKLLVLRYNKSEWFSSAYTYPIFIPTYIHEPLFKRYVTTFTSIDLHLITSNGITDVSSEFKQSRKLSFPKYVTDIIN
jgi:hypothetical protein